MTTSDNRPTIEDIPFPGSFGLDPAPRWRELIEREPIIRVRGVSGSVLWLVTRYHDVRLVLTDRRFSRAMTVAPDSPVVGVGRPLPNTLATTDPPEHTRLRSRVSAAFAPRTVETLRPWIRGLATELATGVRDQLHDVGEVDLRPLFSLPLPIQVICQLLGVPTADRERFRRWAEAGYTLNADERDSADQAMAAMRDYMSRLVRSRSAVATDDVLSGLLRHPDHPEVDEVVNFAVNLLLSGFETSANQISTFVATLLRDDSWRRLVDDPSLIPTAVEELLRVSRLTEVGQLRIAREEVRIAEVTIRPGEGVMAAVAAANRDPAVFPEPDRLDLGRRPNPHLALGAGPHICLGAQLARIELAEALSALTSVLPDLRLVHSPEDLTWRRSLLCGLTELPVALHS